MSPDQQGQPAPPAAPVNPSQPRWNDPAAFAATAPPNAGSEGEPRRSFPGAGSNQYSAPDAGSGQYRGPDASSGQHRGPDASSGGYRAEPSVQQPPPAPENPSSPPPQGVALTPSRTQAQRDAGAQDPEQVAPGSPAALAGFLVSYDERELGQFWPINQGPNSVGRKGAADNLSVEIDHPTTSSRHATVLASARPARMKIEDQGSTNGTFVNDQKLEPGRRHELKDGDVVRFGGFVVLVKII